MDIAKLIKSTKTKGEVIQGKKKRVLELKDSMERLQIIKEENDAEKIRLNYEKLNIATGRFQVNNSDEVRISVLENQKNELVISNKFNELSKEYSSLSNSIKEYEDTIIHNKLGGTHE